mmetsp:Transcript_17372/g.52480  ORF Transcript_17372/g.52480 Transcript_17372/m.52480 type:complete len:208 (-) Transcript_17372:181-804(-)
MLAARSLIVLCALAVHAQWEERSLSEDFGSGPDFDPGSGVLDEPALPPLPPIPVQPLPMPPPAVPAPITPSPSAPAPLSPSRGTPLPLSPSPLPLHPPPPPAASLPLNAPLSPPGSTSSPSSPPAAPASGGLSEWVLMVIIGCSGVGGVIVASCILAVCCLRFWEGERSRGNNLRSRGFEMQAAMGGVAGQGSLRSARKKGRNDLQV